MRARSCIFRKIARRTISSRLSLAWPGQNCPEWLCIENAMIDFDVSVNFVDVLRSDKPKKNSKL